LHGAVKACMMLKVHGVHFPKIPMFSMGNDGGASLC
jgi:hypothetical protein